MSYLSRDDADKLWDLASNYAEVFDLVDETLAEKASDALIAFLDSLVSESTVEYGVPSGALGIVPVRHVNPHDMPYLHEREAGPWTPVGPEPGPEKCPNCNHPAKHHGRHGCNAGYNDDTGLDFHCYCKWSPGEPEQAGNDD